MRVVGVISQPCSRHHLPVPESHLPIQFTMRAFAWLLRQSSISFYNFTGREEHGVRIKGSDVVQRFEIWGQTVL
jgi:hypothetical protein